MKTSGASAGVPKKKGAPNGPKESSGHTGEGKKGSSEGDDARLTNGGLEGDGATGGRAAGGKTTAPTSAAKAKSTGQEVSDEDVGDKAKQVALKSSKASGGAAAAGLLDKKEISDDTESDDSTEKPKGKTSGTKRKSAAVASPTQRSNKRAKWSGSNQVQHFMRAHQNKHIGGDGRVLSGLGHFAMAVRHPETGHEVMAALVDLDQKAILEAETKRVNNRMKRELEDEVDRRVAELHDKDYDEDLSRAIVKRWKADKGEAEYDTRRESRMVAIRSEMAATRGKLLDGANGPTRGPDGGMVCKVPWPGSNIGRGGNGGTP
ncbi:expressed unknown protein [Seminavis robusta]|uniref:Uncharacterized protein n=1 Tax=Seminavis robusta TaxID=568900 RepID=A0A9N8EWM6_9STRA|nr:expressed unknown protein [Seminavis robusta]|eukprot:Sro2049_g312580.1 n/a (319) ;mRNA; r:17414-18370